MRYFFLLIAFMPVHVIAQDLAELESKIADAYQRMANAGPDEERLSHAEEIRKLFIDALDQGASDVFQCPFSSLKMCTLTAPDNGLRLFNWNLPLSDGTYKYYCFVLLADWKKGTVTWTELVDAPREADKPETKFLTPEKWIGALYYQIIPVGARRKKQADTYVLLGWDGKDELTTRKIIDAVSVSGNKLRLGAAIFETETGTRKRIILEYSNEVSASVRYFEKKKCIVMDHLSPKSPAMTGIYADYGPDGTYDLLQLMRNGKWEWKTDIDVSQFAEDDDRPYVDPRLTR